MTPTRHAIDWFEIPVRDLDRAITFDEALLATTIRRETIGGGAVGIIKYDAESVGGCLCRFQDAEAPQPSLDAALARAESLGARITTPKVTLPGDMGCFAHIVDTEGNRVGLHARV